MRDSGDFEQRVKRSIQASVAVKELLLGNAEVVSHIAKVSSLLVESFDKGNKAILFGNGGSAGDAQHIAAEFVGRFAFDRPALPALALSVNTSCVTAIGNDYGFDLVFSRQIEALARPGDLAIGISTSGNSPNVVKALEWAKKNGLYTIGLVGAKRGRVAEFADQLIVIDSPHYGRVEDAHMGICHMVCYAFMENPELGKV